MLNESNSKFVSWNLLKNGMGINHLLKMGDGETDPDDILCVLFAKIFHSPFKVEKM